MFESESRSENKAPRGTLLFVKVVGTRMQIFVPLRGVVLVIKQTFVLGTKTLDLLLFGTGVSEANLAACGCESVEAVPKSFRRATVLFVYRTGILDSP